MTTQEQIALASVVIAATSLAANVVMGITIYRLNRTNVTRDDVEDVVRSLLQRLEYTRLFEVDPDEEIWEFGFESLRELALQCAPALVAVKHSRFANEDTRAAVSQLNDHVKVLRALQDSWRMFRDGKGSNWRDIQRTWPDIERAKAALQAARPVAQHCKRSLLGFLDAA